MTIERPVGDPAVAYQDAPDYDDEMAWLRMHTDTSGFERNRQFWLRRAALLDRIALRETETHGPEATVPLIRQAQSAAAELVEYDTAHRGLSPKGADLVAGEEHREYVREEYRVWRLSQTN